MDLVLSIFAGRLPCRRGSVARALRREAGGEREGNRSAHAGSAAVGAAARIAQRARCMAVREELRRRAQYPTRNSDASFASPPPSCCGPTARSSSRKDPKASRTPATGSSPAASSSLARRRAMPSIASLHEELGIEVTRASPWLLQEFVYPHAHVELNFFRVFEWDGELASRDGQAFEWQTPGTYTVAPLLPANTRILAALDLPIVYGITNAEDSDEETFLGHAYRALEGGLRLVQVRDKTWPLARRIDVRARGRRSRASLRRASAVERHGRRSARGDMRRRSLALGDAQRSCRAASRHVGRRVVPHRARHRACGRTRSRLRTAWSIGADAHASCGDASRVGGVRAHGASHARSAVRAGRFDDSRLAQGHRRGCARRRLAPRLLVARAGFDTGSAGGHWPACVFPSPPLRRQSSLWGSGPPGQDPADRRPRSCSARRPSRRDR